MGNIVAQVGNALTEMGRAATPLIEAARSASESLDSYFRVVFRARRGETTAEAGRRFETEQVAMWVGHPVQRLKA